MTSYHSWYYKSSTQSAALSYLCNMFHDHAFNTPVLLTVIVPIQYILRLCTHTITLHVPVTHFQKVHAAMATRQWFTSRVVFGHE